MTLTFVTPLAFDSTPTAIPGVTQLQTIVGYTAWIATAVCLIGLLVTGAMMGLSYQHGSNEHVGRLGAVVAGCLIVGASSALAGSFLGFNLFTSTPEAIPGLTTVQTVIGYVAYACAAACLIGLIIAGMLLASSYRRGGDSFGRLASVCAGCVVVGSAGTLIGALI